MLRGRSYLPPAPALRGDYNLHLDFLSDLRPVSADVTSSRWRMISQQPSTEVGSVLDILEGSSRVAQLEAEIAQLKDALARRQQIGVATGLLAQRFSAYPGAGLVTAGTPLPELPCQGPRHRSGLDQCSLRSTQSSRGRDHLRDGVASARWCTPDRYSSSQLAPAERTAAVIGLDTPRRLDHDRGR